MRQTVTAHITGGESVYEHMEWKNDPYRQARGGYARLLAVSCATCGTHLFSYQKDGPGIVKRLYLDRIYQSHAASITASATFGHSE